VPQKSKAVVRNISQTQTIQIRQTGELSQIGFKIQHNVETQKLIHCFLICIRHYEI
jgi:hypothetical protein